MSGALLRASKGGMSMKGGERPARGMLKASNEEALQGAFGAGLDLLDDGIMLAGS